MAFKSIFINLHPNDSFERLRKAKRDRKVETRAITMTLRAIEQQQ